jgi:hypothetical protein
VGIDAPATAATVAAGDGRRLIVAFVAGGRLYGSYAPGANQLAPPSAPQVLAEGPVTSADADMGINGTGYVVFAGAGDVGAVRLDATTWEGVNAPLDVDPAQAAGLGLGARASRSRPRATRSPPGASPHPDGRTRVYGRRITGLTPSLAPQEVSLPEIDGARAATPTPRTSTSRTTAPTRGSRGARTRARRRGRSCAGSWARSSRRPRPSTEG